LRSHSYVIHHGALGIARNLGQAGVPVYAIVEDRFTPLALSRYLARRFVLTPADFSDEGRLLSALLAIGKSLSQPVILVPTDDRAAVIMAEHAHQLRPWFLFPDVPEELPRQLADKASLYALCRKSGTPCPEDVVPKSIDDVHEFIARAKFPVAVKVAANWRRSACVRVTQIVRTAGELAALFDCIDDDDWKNPNIIIQEYIPGEDWIVHGYSSQKTGCFLAFTGRKLRSYPAFAGLTTLGVPVVNEPLASQIEQFVNAVGYSGIMDIDCRFDSRDGKYKLLDFNPRVGMNFRMFDDQAGNNAVRALHLDLTGRPVAPAPLVEGRVFIAEPFDLLASLSYLHERKLTPAQLLSSWRGPKELAWFSWRDPLPFLSMCVRLLPNIVFRLGRAGLGSLAARRQANNNSPPAASHRPASRGRFRRARS
jgi:predicted ATP-grasp superfamily ATP-dependent carboligase